MARRFYDTGLIDQSWYIDLEPKFKALYMHLLCYCDNVGIFEINPRMFSYMIGDNITRDDIFTRFGNRVRQLSDTKAILVDFVSFQCGGELRQGCRPHDSILKRLNEVGLPIEELQSLCTKELKFVPLNSMQTVSKQLKTKTKTEIKIDTKKDDVDDEPKFDTESKFAEFWNQYPNKASKAGAKNKFITRLAEKGSVQAKEKLFETIMASLKNHKMTAQWLKNNGEFIPMAQTWLNQRRYEDEVTIMKGDSNGIGNRIKVADNFYSESISADKSF